MQFENFDKKIKEAAENHHPAYDEQAWGKMNTLLDKHMPVKEERRRRFVWLYFLLFLIGGTGIFYGVQSLVASKTFRTEVPESETDVTVNSSDKENKGLPADGQLVKPVQNKTQQSTVLSKSQSPVVPRNKVALKPASDNEQRPAIITTDFQSGVAKKKKKATAVPNTVTIKPVPVIMPDSQTELKDDKAEPDKVNPQSDPLTIQTVINKPAVSADVKTAPSQIQNDSAAVAAADPELPVKKQAAKKRSQFYLTLSAGPDASFTNNGKPGRIIPVTGAGIGFTYRERLSVRAGFYNAAKVYSASPDAYHAPASFYNYYPFLTKVDANCRVYEIPVSFGYHFGARKNHSWFASATLSSYLMKRETYNYSYKTSAWGTVQQREWTFNNSNQHLFSVLGISGGYQRKITERISFIAEPYLRMPLNGVGYGKVNLNSAGVLFSIAVQPAAFIPRKQKK